MMSPAIDRLPEEILLQIFTELDRQPPSVTRARHEPTLELTVDSNQHLKSISCVSKSWRRIVLPLLFKHLKLRLDRQSREQLRRWRQCPYCSESALKGGRVPDPSDLGKIPDVDAYHQQLAIKMPSSSKFKLTTDPDQYVENLDDLNDFEDTGSAAYLQSDDANTRNAVVEWVPRIYHGLKDLLVFLEQSNLTNKIESFFVATPRMLPRILSRHHQAANRDWRCRAATAFWQHMFSVLNPKTISILASPDDLACLTCCVIDLSGDWAFEDMDFHLLTLSQKSTAGTKDYRSLPVNSDELKKQSFDLRPGMVGRSSIFNLRDWTAVSLNEGSFLNSYGTYEFYERNAPSTYAGINNHLFKNMSGSRSGGLKKVRHFTYTAIFSYATHARFVEMLGHLETLDLQLAPLPESGILDNKLRIGKAELPDCWHELTSTYANLASQLATFQINAQRVPNLKTFICRDALIPGLRDELDNIFTMLCLPVWAEMEPGVYKRLKDAVDPEALEAYQAMEF